MTLRGPNCIKTKDGLPKVHLLSHISPPNFMTFLSWRYGLFSIYTKGKDSISAMAMSDRYLFSHFYNNLNSHSKMYGMYSICIHLPSYKIWNQVERFEVEHWVLSNGSGLVPLKNGLFVTVFQCICHKWVCRCRPTYGRCYIILEYDAISESVGEDPLTASYSKIR